MAGNQFEKECKDCHKQIIMQKTDGGWKALNPDFTPHHCQKQPPAEQKKDEPDSMIGTYQGITFKRISVVRKDKKILSSATTAKLLESLADPANPVKVGMKIKVTFDKDGNADQIEICPDQPAPQPNDHTKPSQPQGNTQSSCTSPESPAAPRVQPKREHPDRDMLLSMCSSADGYWKAKFYLDLRRCEEIRQQSEVKNWQEAISLAIAYQQARPVENEGVFESATKIHDFIAGKIAGAPAS